MTIDVVFTTPPTAPSLARPLQLNQEFTDWNAWLNVHVPELVTWTTQANALSLQVNGSGLFTSVEFTTNGAANNPLVKLGQNGSLEYTGLWYGGDNAIGFGAADSEVALLIKDSGFSLNGSDYFLQAIGSGAGAIWSLDAPRLLLGVAVDGDYPSNATLEVLSSNQDVLALARDANANNASTAVAYVLKNDAGTPEWVEYAQVVGGIDGAGQTDGSENGRLIFRILNQGTSFDPITLTRNAVTLENSAGTGVVFTSADEFRPNASGDDNTISLGTSNRRWTEVFAAVGSINTSDRREKDDFALPGADLLRAGWQMARSVCTYRMREAKGRKGDGARTHVGLIAQGVRDTLAAVGLNPFKYGILCHDSWTEEDGSEGDRYSLRPDEANILMIASMADKIEKLEKRIEELETDAG